MFVNGVTSTSVPFPFMVASSSESNWEIVTLENLDFLLDLIRFFVVFGVLLGRGGYGYVLELLWWMGMITSKFFRFRLLSYCIRILINVLKNLRFKILVYVIFLHFHYLRGAIMISFSRAIKLQTNSNSNSLFLSFFL